MHTQTQATTRVFSELLPHFGAFPCSSHLHVCIQNSPRSANVWSLIICFFGEEFRVNANMKVMGTARPVAASSRSCLGSSWALKTWSFLHLLLLLLQKKNWTALLLCLCSRCNNRPCRCKFMQGNKTRNHLYALFPCLLWPHVALWSVKIGPLQNHFFVANFRET